MAVKLSVSTDPAVTVVGTRYSAIELRGAVDTALAKEGEVHLDFANLTVTQSFADALLGPLALRYGPKLLQRVTFSGCSEQVRSVIQLVLSHRLDQYASRQALQECDAGEETVEA